LPPRVNSPWGNQSRLGSDDFLTASQSWRSTADNNLEVTREFEPKLAWLIRSLSPTRNTSASKHLPNTYDSRCMFKHIIPRPATTLQHVHTVCAKYKAYMSLRDASPSSFIVHQCLLRSSFFMLLKSRIRLLASSLIHSCITCSRCSPAFRYSSLCSSHSSFTGT
jgi:hypothetical protein